MLSWVSPFNIIIHAKMLLIAYHVITLQYYLITIGILRFHIKLLDRSSGRHGPTLEFLVPLLFKV